MNRAEFDKFYNNFGFEKMNFKPSQKILDEQWEITQLAAKCIKIGMGRELAVEDLAKQYEEYWEEFGRDDYNQKMASRN